MPRIENPISERTVLLNDKNVDRESNGEDEKRKRVLMTAALAFTMLVQSYLLVGVFPYSGFMAMHLVPNLNEETAGSYAGLIASSFMVGRTFSSFEWGKIADRYGRVFVIKASLLLSAVFSILFGLSPTFYMALFLRSMLGLSNGLIGPIKTLICEISQGDKTKETQMMALIMGMWGYGFLINPAIAGFLSDPVKQHPDAEFVEMLEPILTAYPFILPNVVGCLFCLIAYILVHNFVEETLPVEKRQQFGLNTIIPFRKNVIRSVSSWGLFKHLDYAQAEISDETVISSPPSKEKRGGEIAKEEEEPATIHSLWKRKATRQHLLVYWVFSFIVITVDETFPLFCMSKASGLAIQEKMIGKILSGTGFFYITIQYFLLTGLVDRFGIYRTLRIGAFLSVPLCSLIPVTLITNKDTPEGTLTLLTFVFLSIVYAIARVFSSVVFSTISMTLNQTVPAHQRATMNGLSMLGGSFAKACGPAFGGILFSSSVGYFTPPNGSVVVYSIIAFLGLCLGVQTLFLEEYSVPEASVTLVEAEQEHCIQDNHDEEDIPPTF